MAQSRFYEVTVKVLVVAPPDHSRAVIKSVHGLVQEFLPGIELDYPDYDACRIVGASAIGATDSGPSEDPE